MRILGIHSRGEIWGGADRVYIYGNRLLHERGHALAWMHFGPSSVANSLGNPVFSLPNTNTTMKTIQKQVGIVKGLLYSKEAVLVAQRAVREFKPDIVHAHNIRGFFSPAIFRVFQQQGIPVVQTLHDYRLICPVNSFLSGGQVCEACKGRQYYWCAVKRCANGGLLPSLVFSLSGYVGDYGYRYDKLIRRYIAPGEFLRKKMIEFGYDPKKITKLNNAYFSSNTPEISSQRKSILFVGRLAHEKGVDLLIRASAGLSVPVLIAGDGPARQDLEGLARELNAKKVAFLGFQNPDSMKKLYAEAQVVVFPSRWYENGPLVILEAYANGTPVVGADIGAIPEFIEDRETGYLFESNNADSLRQVLQRALADPAALQRMGAYARKQVEEKYSPGLYAQKLEKFLESVL